MTLYHFSEGELCPLTSETGCVGLPGANVDTSPTEPMVTSRGCNHCRFHKYVVVMTTTDCWLWTGTFYSQFGKPTYGQAWLNGRRIGAHRVSYLLHVGAVPDGLDVLHSCDIKACVNPAHLRPGTHAENIQEAFAKLPPGHFGGENNGHARLNWDIVHAIRSVGGRTMDLALEHGVTTTQITAIKHGRRWPEAKCPIHGTSEYRQQTADVA